MKLRILAAVLVLGACQLLRREEAPAREISALTVAPRTPSPRALKDGGKTILVAPGTGELWLAEPSEVQGLLGQGYQLATRADVEAHNAELGR